MRRLLFYIIYLMPLVSVAQTWPFEFWHEGKVVLESGDTLKGQVKYDLQQDLVQCIYREDRVEAFSARKVLFFEIFDETAHRYRDFYALPYNATAGYKTPVFFELLVQGKMTLLSREALEYKTYSSSFYMGSYTRQVLVDYYFFLKENGEIEEFKGSKNDLFNLMGKKSNLVEKYIKDNRLKFDEKYDLVKIVAYYNSLF
jgi:hypothetical protein